jgi:hypothetical protein
MFPPKNSRLEMAQEERKKAPKILFSGPHTNSSQIF